MKFSNAKVIGLPITGKLQLKTPIISVLVGVRFA